MNIGDESFRRVIRIKSDQLNKEKECVVYLLSSLDMEDIRLHNIDCRVDDESLTLCQGSHLNHLSAIFIPNL